MKTYVIPVLVILLCKFTLTSSQNEVGKDKTKGTLKVIIEGLKNDSGAVQIGLFNTEESWNEKEEKFKGAIITIKDRRIEWIIEDIPFGEYAVRFFHDENGNNEMDMNFIGMPTETYGFSNNAKAIFGMPGYQKAKFMFDSKNTTETIKI